MYQPFQLTSVLQSNTMPSLETKYEQAGVAQAAFMMALQDYTARAKQEIKARKDAYERKQREDEERKKEYEKEMEDSAAKEMKMIEKVSRERSETVELESHVASLQKQESSTIEKCNRKDEEMEELKKKILLLRGGLSKDKEVLYAHARRTAKEGKALQDALGWSIEGIQKDMLLFRFTNIDSVDSSREFSIILDVSQRNYKVSSSTPLLPCLPSLLASLNEDRQFYSFIRRVRQAFRQHVEEEQRFKGTI